MATISNTPRPGYAWDATDNCWYPIGTGPHTHSDYITQSTAINPSIVDAKGDLIVGSAADTVIRKPVGTDGQLLYADSTATGGIKWDAAPASGSMTLLSTTTLSGSSVTISSINQSYKNLLIYVTSISNATETNYRLRINDTNLTPSSGIDESGIARTNNSDIRIIGGFSYDLSSGTYPNSGAVVIYNYASTTQYKPFSLSFGANYSGFGPGGGTFGGHYRETTAVSSIKINANAGSFTGGTVLIYGVN